MINNKHFASTKEGKVLTVNTYVDEDVMILLFGSEYCR